MASTLEAEFLDFRRTGDVRALAVVFDRTAAELLRLAMHWARDPSEAEDLVQGTFLAAIQGADRFDGDRRLLPWLVGILANQARAARRRRRPAVALPPDAADTGETPVVAASRREADREVGRAIDGMGDPYRTVLYLHLRCGLTAPQIAAAMSRSPATVRSQIARGLARLREALPRGLALPLALLALGQGLGAMRRIVMERAASAASGGLLMKSKAILCAAAICTAGVAAGTVALAPTGAPWLGPTAALPAVSQAVVAPPGERPARDGPVRASPPVRLPAQAHGNDPERRATPPARAGETPRSRATSPERPQMPPVRNAATPWTAAAAGSIPGCQGQSAGAQRSGLGDKGCVECHGQVPAGGELRVMPVLTALEASAAEAARRAVEPFVEERLAPARARHVEDLAPLAEDVARMVANLREASERHDPETEAGREALAALREEARADLEARLRGWGSAEAVERAVAAALSEARFGVFTFQAVPKGP